MADETVPQNGRIPHNVRYRVVEPRELKLSQADEDLRHAYKWRLIGAGYIKTTKMRGELLHRIVAARVLGRPLVKGETVDHINNDPFDNTRSNLRVVPLQHNCHNKSLKPRRDRKSPGPRGVYRTPNGKRWAVYFRHSVKGEKPRCVYLGTYDTAEEGQAAYLAYRNSLPGNAEAA